MTYTIDKNIPFPGRGSGKVSELKKTVLAMEVGDSIFLEAPTRSDIATTIEFARKSCPDSKFSQRNVNGGARIWRVA